MRNFISSALLAVLCSACTTLKKPFYYEIERNGQKSYVLGTAHFGFEASELPSHVVSQLKMSSTFASEIHTEWAEKDENDLLDERASRLWSRYGQNKISSYKLSSLLSPKAWAIVQKELSEGLKKKPELKSLSEIEKLPPGLALSLVDMFKSRRVYMSHAQYYGLKKGRLDRELYALAKKKSLNILNLDHASPIDEKCYDHMDLNALEKFANTGVLTTAEDLDTFFYVYESGDEELLTKYAQSGFSRNTNQCVLAERNELWARKLDSAYDTRQPLFIAVGAAHLVGENSLLALLRGRGFAVRRITGAPQSLAK